MRNAAIVLAAGSGSRMKSSVKKQYLLLDGKPVLWYSLQAFEQCPRIDEVVLVCGEQERDWCRTEIVDRYGFTKINQIVAGGKERYHSVYEGLKALTDCDYVLIHDGARPFADRELLNRILDDLPQSRASVAAVPVKDTIKLGGRDGYVERTLPRERLWSVQTPQSFAYPLIRSAYDTVMQEKPSNLVITDDAMVAEYSGIPVKLIEGSYDNIKLTTPADLYLAEEILHKREQSHESQNEPRKK